jgi:multimeric flavodoxin WrbA
VPKRLTIVYHSQSGATARLAAAVSRGARQEAEIDVCCVPALEAGLAELLAADALLFGSAEYLGYLSGGLKDFFDRTFYPAQPHELNRPYALFVSAGNDGSNAVRQAQRILTGYPMKQVAEPLIVRGEPDQRGLQRCEELGLTLAAGLAMGIF